MHPNPVTIISSIVIIIIFFFGGCNSQFSAIVSQVRVRLLQRRLFTEQGKQQQSYSSGAFHADRQTDTLYLRMAAFFGWDLGMHNLCT